jgi:hypothetical protein
MFEFETCNKEEKSFHRRHGRHSEKKKQVFFCIHIGWLSLCAIVEKIEL